MAHIKSMLFKGFSGKIGKLVFRTRGNQTFVSMAPGPRKTKPTPAQEAIKEKFTKAARYAAEAYKDPGLKALYGPRKKGISAYNLAMKDAFQVPVISSINPHIRKGVPGKTIRIDIGDNTPISQVSIIVTGPGGTLIEQGNAFEIKHGLYWVYKLQHPGQVVPGSSIQAKAVNYPGNEGVLRITI